MVTAHIVFFSFSFYAAIRNRSSVFRGKEGHEKERVCESCACVRVDTSLLKATEITSAMTGVTSHDGSNVKQYVGRKQQRPGF